MSSVIIDGCKPNDEGKHNEDDHTGLSPSALVMSPRQYPLDFEALIARAVAVTLASATTALVPRRSKVSLQHGEKPKRMQEDATLTEWIR